MARILILNGSPRRNGKTASLIRAFTEGAESAGNEVEELHLCSMDIKGCIACEECRDNGGNCVLKDDMHLVYDGYIRADVIVFASPEFWGSITGQLKTTIDRLFAIFGKKDPSLVKKKCVLIMTARTDKYEVSENYYSIFPRVLGWEDLGRILGAGKEDQAKALGAAIR